ncbi:MAG: di-heme oxidoredictase family protein [Hyphomicrobiaceae bacterium]
MRRLHLFIAVAFAVPIGVGAVVLAKERETAKLAALQPGEWFPGGTATTRKAATHRDVFSQPSRGMGFEEQSNFQIGNAIFRKLWVSSPASTKSSDGLGPLYNARACQNCHLKDGRGHAPSANWPDDDAISMIVKLAIPPQDDSDRKLLAERQLSFIAEPTYGGQLQDLSVQGHDGEGRIHITYTDVPVALADGTVIKLRQPNYKIVDLKYGALHPQTHLSPRVAPQMIGLGLLEAIPAADIRAGGDPDDANGDGISGRASIVRSFATKDLTLGRFGWKAATANVREQSAAAFSGDMGLSTSLRTAPAGDCTKLQTICLNAPHGTTLEAESYEVSDQLLDFTVFYSQNLAVPRRRNADASEVLLGKSIFSTLGCASCHKPSFKTGNVADQKHLSNQVIWPYTDMLLHDMGEGLADNFVEGTATGREWRTPPLWGIGLTQVVSGHAQLLHDGRARNVEEAILWHGGESQAARDGFAQLSKVERDALIRFVNSL